MKISSVLLAANSTYGARSEFENFFEFLRRDPQIETVAVAHPLLRRQEIQSTKDSVVTSRGNQREYSRASLKTPTIFFGRQVSVAIEK